MDQLDKTLAEQLSMTAHELEMRKNLLGFTRADEDILKQHRPLFAKSLDDIVKKFYDKQIEFPEISLLIGDVETLRRLKSAMRRYILELFDGIYDMEYVNKRLRIGKVHQRIGVSPKLYIAAIRLLEDELLGAISGHQFTDENPEQVELLKKALNKLLMLDIQLVFDTYISSLVREAESARTELRDYADTLEETVRLRTAELEELSTKDMLTNIYNQRAFYDHLRRELSVAERYKESLSLCYIDLNQFKDLNDNQGHYAGDGLLALFGASMMKALRETDIACRYGGDEFAIILPRTNIEEARLVINRLVEEFRKVNHTAVTFSAGISETGPEEFLDADSLVKDADKRMYQAKARAKKKAGYYIVE